MTPPAASSRTCRRAAAAAIAGNYGIEADLQISADGEAMVHHDGALGRLADGDGALRDLTAARLKQVPFKATAERMMTLGDLCDLVASRVTLVLELKSRFDGDLPHRRPHGRRCSPPTTGRSGSARSTRR